MKNILDGFLKFIFPRYCIGCKKKDYFVCQNCKNSIILQSVPEGAQISSCFSYEQKIVMEIIKCLKFKNKKYILNDIKDLILGQFENFLKKQKIGNNEEIILIPIPLTKRSLSKRGYNQSLVISKILKSENIKIYKNSLIKKTNHLPQNKIRNRKEREENVKNSFTLKRKLPQNQVYILIDDVTTTGSTILEAKKELRKNGVKRVIAFTLAH